MPRPLALPLAAAAALAALPLSPRAEAPPAGRVETDEGRVEILSRPLRAGDRIDLPEGYLVVEEDGPESTGVGSFGVVSSRALASAGGVLPDAAGAPDPAGPAASAPAARPCAAERTAYLAELWKGSGIEVEDPAAFLDGLEAGAGGPATGYYWFALQADPFRPLAWSSTLRARADALARCVRAAGAGAAGESTSAALAGR